MPLFSGYKYEYLNEETDDESESDFEYQSFEQHEHEHEHEHGYDHSPSKSNSKVEYKMYEHITLPSDTLEGICLRYRITPTKLRQANGFTGNNLHLAPKKLMVPVPVKGGQQVCANKNTNPNPNPRPQDRTTKEFMIHFTMANYVFMNQKEAEGYLKIFDWDVEKAGKGIEEDLAWENNYTNANDNHIAGGVGNRLRLRPSLLRMNKNINFCRENENENENEDAQREQRQAETRNCNKQKLDIVTGVPLGVNHYAWKELGGIEMKNLSPLKVTVPENMHIYRAPTIVPVPA